MLVPDRLSTDPVLGWRYWYVITPGAVLSSPVMATYNWPRGTRAVADCKDHVEPAPHPNCSCGFYAKARSDELEVPEGSRSVLIAVGQVSLWGTVLQHERGWKAQYAYPYAVQLQVVAGAVTDYERTARRLAAAYQVDVGVEYAHGHRQSDRAPAHRDHPSQ